MVIKAPHQTRVRPPTEPYELHRERQRRQQKDLKLYLRNGPTRHVSTLLIPLVLNPPGFSGFTRRLNEKRYYRKAKVDGTYVMPICPFCNKKEKRCKCMEDI